MGTHIGPDIRGMQTVMSLSRKLPRQSAVIEFDHRRRLSLLKVLPARSRNQAIRSSQIGFGVAPESEKRNGG